MIMPFWTFLYLVVSFNFSLTTLASDIWKYAYWGTMLFPPLENYIIQAVISFPLFGDTCATKGINGEGCRFKGLEEDSLTEDYLPNN